MTKAEVKLTKIEKDNRTRIARAFSNMPYGAGLNFTFIRWDEYDAEALLPIIGSNLEKIRDFLLEHSKEQDIQQRELLTLQNAVMSVQYLLEYGKSSEHVIRPTGP